jgi:TolB-like protein/Tfp pilus assembly protein PilF
MAALRFFQQETSRARSGHDTSFPFMAVRSEPISSKRLDSWKEIASFFGRAERTVKRWETERGLPVHRVPGGGRSAVFAYTNELAYWLKGRSDELDTEDVASGELDDGKTDSAGAGTVQPAVPVQAVSPQPVPPQPVPTQPSPVIVRSWPPSRLAAWLVPFLLAAGLITYFSIGHNGPRIKALANRQPGSPASPDLYIGPDSVAVLPFTNERGDANADYLSDGITESLIGNLAHVPQLKVRSRDSVFRYKGKDTEVRTAGSNLGVAVVVSGRVILQGDSVVVSAEMTDVRDNTEIWGHRYAGKSANLISLQQQIAGDIAGKLRATLSPAAKQQIINQGTQDAQAYSLYLKGRYAWNKRTRADLETAVSDFNQAIADDPEYALAYSGLADTYSVLPFFGANPNEELAKSNAAARKALQLDSTLAHPHAVLGSNEMGYEWDFAGGEAEFKKAIELDPNDATAHQWYAESLSTLPGREQEALAEINRAHQLDPLSPIISRVIGSIQVTARHYDEAISVCKQLINENPTFATAHDCLGYAYWGKQMYPQVIEEWNTYGQIDGNPEDAKFASALDQGFRSSGWRGALTQGIAILQARRKTYYCSAYLIARLYADLGDKEQAFRWLDTAYREHDFLLVGLATQFQFDPLRSDPRFGELMHKVGFPKPQ